MYVNKCIKCGAEFETKNPKRVICPNCLYAEKKAESGSPLQAWFPATRLTARLLPKKKSKSLI